MQSFSRPRGCSFLVQSHVDKLDNGGMALTMGNGQRKFIPWPLLGLTEAPEIGNGEKCILRWRLHCVDPDSGTKEFFAGERNRWVLSASQGRSISYQTAQLRTGVLEVEMHMERRAILDLLVASTSQDLPARLNLAEPLSVCLEHRQPWDKGACCLCGRELPHMLRQRNSSDQFSSTASYAARWGAMVELEAGASAIESNDSRFLFNVYVNWEPQKHGAARRGSFGVSVALARAHKLKFRGLLAQGGERASGWLCMRDDASDREHRSPWSGHARIVAAGILGEGAELGLDDEDNLKSVDGRRSITVVFEMLDEVSDPGTPHGDFLFIEYIQKALSHSMQHTALAEVNPQPPKDGSMPKFLLARDVVLSRLPPSTSIDSADISQWKVNSSQDQAVRRALVRSLMLVHGPPGTGKTRTAAILMTLLAQRNLGARCAMLFAAPTNKACDAALHSTNRLCQGHFAERLRARVEDDGEADCAICLEGAPDIVTACGHVFHRACLGRALQETSKCPMCRQVLKQHGGGLRILRVYGADTEREDFPVPRRIDHKGIQTFKTQTVPVEMRRFTLHWRCHAAVEDEEPSAEALKTRRAYDRLRATNPRSTEFDQCRAEYFEALTKARAVEVHQSDIIFTTCVSARRMALVAALEAEGAPELRQVVLDEAGQAPEPEALCPLAVARRARQAIFFGDHKQLRPILKSRIAQEAGLGISLFERLATQDWNGHGEPPVALLAQQYRMHPEISRFPRQQFYGGSVLDDSSVFDRALGLLSHPETDKCAAYLLWDTAGCNSGNQEHLQRVRTVGAGGVGSRSNIEEAQRAASLATKLAREAGVKSVAVLSWYNNQVAKVSEILRRSGMHGVHVGSIATAQGSEWDYVILSAVRSGSGGGSLGLVADPHNLNVALTRAKLGLVVLCDTNAVSRDPNWNALIKQSIADGQVVRERPTVRRNPNPTVSTNNQVLCAAVPPPPPPAPLLVPPTSLMYDRNLREQKQSVSGTEGAVKGKQQSDLLDNSFEVQMQIAALIAMQSQSQLQRCACGNFANPSLNGRCNGCSLQTVYMNLPSSLNSASFPGELQSAFMPQALHHTSFQDYLPVNEVAPVQTNHRLQLQPNRPSSFQVLAQKTEQACATSKDARSSRECRQRCRSSSSESEWHSWRAPQSHASKTKCRGSSSDRKSHSQCSDQQSNDEPARLDTRKHRSFERSPASGRSAGTSSRSRSCSSRRRLRTARTSKPSGSHCQQSPEQAERRRGARNALFSYSPGQRSIKQTSNLNESDHLMGG